MKQSSGKIFYKKSGYTRTMNLNRSQLSLIITFFSMALVVLLLFNIHLGGMQEDEYVIEMSLADEDIEELLKS